MVLVRKDGDILKIICPLCGVEAPIKIDRNDRFYWVCEGLCDLRMFFGTRATNLVVGLFKEKMKKGEGKKV